MKYTCSCGLNLQGGGMHGVGAGDELRYLHAQAVHAFMCQAFHSQLPALKKGGAVRRAGAL